MASSSARSAPRSIPKAHHGPGTPGIRATGIPGPNGGSPRTGRPPRTRRPGSLSTLPTEPPTDTPARELIDPPTEPPTDTPAGELIDPPTDPPTGELIDPPPDPPEDPRRRRKDSRDGQTEQNGKQRLPLRSPKKVRFQTVEEVEVDLEDGDTTRTPVGNRPAESLKVVEHGDLPYPEQHYVGRITDVLTDEKGHPYIAQKPNTRGSAPWPRSR